MANEAPTSRERVSSFIVVLFDRVRMGIVILWCPRKEKTKGMLRTAVAILFVTLAVVGSSQTVFRITNVTVAEKAEVRRGLDATAMMDGDEGADRVVIFAE